MVACHTHDLRAAKNVGFRTAHVARAREWGVERPSPQPDQDFDILAGDLVDLARHLGT